MLSRDKDLSPGQKGSAKTLDDPETKQLIRSLQESSLPAAARQQVIDQIKRSLGLSAQLSNQEFFHMIETGEIPKKTVLKPKVRAPKVVTSKLDQGDFKYSENSWKGKLERVVRTTQSMSESDLHKMLKENLQKSGYGRLVAERPKLLNFMTKLYRHPTAVMKMIEITEMTTELRNYFIVFLTTFIAGYLLKKLWADRLFFTRLMRGMILSTVLWLTRGYVFYFAFSKQIKPLLGVMKESFL